MNRYLGEIASDQSRHDEAISLLSQSLDYFTSHNELYTTAHALAYLTVGRPDETRRDLEQALPLTQQLAAPLVVADVYVALARAVAKQGHHDQQRHLRHGRSTPASEHPRSSRSPRSWNN